MFEKTPSYMFKAGVEKRVYLFNKTIKLIAILRDPVNRLLSDYAQVCPLYLNVEMQFLYYRASSLLLAGSLYSSRSIVTWFYCNKGYMVTRSKLTRNLLSCSWEIPVTVIYSAWWIVASNEVKILHD